MYEGIILLAAQAVGGAERALEITVEYSKGREQFDKPIGSFQALAHYMADAVAVIEGAATLVLEAAWAHTRGKSIARLAPMAKLFACNTFRDVTAKCEQIHGGYGFTLEYDIQLFFRRAKQQQMNWWDSRHLEGLIAADAPSHPYSKAIGALARATPPASCWPPTRRSCDLHRGGAWCSSLFRSPFSDG